MKFGVSQMVGQNSQGGDIWHNESLSFEEVVCILVGHGWTEDKARTDLIELHESNGKDWIMLTPNLQIC